MQLEFHQLDRRWEHLRVHQPRLQRRLLASLAESDQQTPIIVVVSPDHGDRYLVIDGHKRIAALQQLGRDTVEAAVWAMSEAEALLLDRTLRFSPRESALEQGWLLSEMEQRFGYSLEELARRLDRSASWVSRRLALVEWLPETIQQQVREGAIAAQVAMKYLVPVARVSERTRMGQTATGKEADRLRGVRQRVPVMQRASPTATDLRQLGAGGHRSGVSQVAATDSTAATPAGPGGRLRLGLVDLADGGQFDADLRPPSART